MEKENAEKKSRKKLPKDASPKKIWKQQQNCNDIETESR